MASGLLPKSPVSSSLCDEVPHIFIPKSHLEPREFLISSAKRLLQQYRHLADIPTAPVFVRFWTILLQKSAMRRARQLPRCIEPFYCARFIWRRGDFEVEALTPATLTQHRRRSSDR